MVFSSLESILLGHSGENDWRNLYLRSRTYTRNLSAPLTSLYPDRHCSIIKRSQTLSLSIPLFLHAALGRTTLLCSN